jgi:hypothetical protein
MGIYMNVISNVPTRTYTNNFYERNQQTYQRASTQTIYMNVISYIPTRTYTNNLYERNQLRTNTHVHKQFI